MKVQHFSHCLLASARKITYMTTGFWVLFIAYPTHGYFSLMSRLITPFWAKRFMYSWISHTLFPFGEWVLATLFRLALRGAHFGAARVSGVGGIPRILGPCCREKKPARAPRPPVKRYSGYGFVFDPVVFTDQLDPLTKIKDFVTIMGINDDMSQKTV